MSFQDFSEFDSNYLIPSDIIDTPLSLEEILKQDDNQLDNVIDERDIQLLNQVEDVDISFLNDSSHNATTSLNINPIPYIKSQIILSKNEKINSGNPSCLTCSKNYIVIGTFCGHILVFDAINEKLKWFWKQEFDFGSIAALSINQDEVKLICGGSKDAVSLWNLNNGELLRLVENIHAPFSSIINLKYLSDLNSVILSDTSGSVFILDTRKKDFDSNCIFTGSRGEVLSILPLVPDDIQNIVGLNGIENLCLVAMATVSKVIVISLKPNLFVHFTYLLKTSPEFLPILSWNFNYRHRNKIYPLLAFGRQDQLLIHKMETDFDDRINFVPLFQFKSSSYNLQNIFWINSDTFILVDTSEIIHLIDVNLQEEIETVDISHVELVYESSNFKSLVNGGYVSKAMAKGGEHACANSFALQRNSTNNRLFILGLNCVFEASIRSWNDKFDFLLKNGEPFSALQFIHRKYISLQEQLEFDDMEQQLKEILDKMGHAFSEFIQLLMKKNIIMSRNETSLRKVMTNVLKYCICLETKYERLEELFDLFQSNLIAKNIFIECMENYIFNGQLTELNPNLVKEIIAYYINRQWYNLLDSLIIHFSITSLDIDHIMKIYQEYNLYDSFIYIYNVALNDFLTPFDQLLQIFHRMINDKVQYTKDDILLGNKLLVYLNCMLTCAYYPNKGHLPLNEQLEHLEKVYYRFVSNDSSGQATILNVLFKYDCTEFLNVILIAFEYLDQNHPELLKWKQTLIDFFLLKIIGDETQQFGPEQQNAFFLFLARCLINNNSISINKKCFIKMVDTLFAKEENKRFEERQQILIQILDEQRFQHYYQQCLFLDNAEKSKMYKICEFIHRKNQDWTQLLCVYIKDSTKEDEVFDFIHSMLSKEFTMKTEKDKNHFLQVVLNNFLVLVKIDSHKSVSLLFAYFDHSEHIFQQIIENLQPEPKVLFQFLKLSILENRINYSKTLSNSNESYRKLFDLCLNSFYQEQYIELACQFEPTSIISILDTFQEYDKSNVLEICKRLNCKDGEAYIFEKTRQFKKSFEILFDTFKQQTNNTIQSCFNDLSNYGDRLQFSLIETKFTALLDFCKRSFKYSIEKQTKESFCLLTLEFMIDLKSMLSNICRMKNEKLPPQFLHLLTEPEKKTLAEQLVIEFNKRFKLLFENLINVMLTHLSLVDFFGIIVNKVLKNDDLYDVREMLLCILENYHYERTLLELTNNILSCEHHQLMGQYQSANIKSRNVTQSYCGLCLAPILTSTDRKSSAVLFTCTHLFHDDCIEELKNTKQLTQILCPLCNVVFDGRSTDQSNSQTEEVEKVESPQSIREKSPNSMSSNSSQLSLIESQFRALNYFHHGRLKKVNRRRKN
ncbi:hypothetical protein RDWZM_008035 [Blomia tropicalis]|uniref:RING-type domain-containing protein n=1 Tax=Blomia tropicalis TaxID=40697 RepID=A0A9Q0RIH9_BLOTA|nr:Vacuolar protein sorting-associated protein 8 [Blomia tropicalis]KAJ6216878.1 hypothetical protein RDWZM_008035 [Blomia tropicalis]